ncbi:phytoene desaturase [Sphingomonas daechungensis]|uniref:Phytoene dehydrogenase n=1 Tax=Sphingomonas daechungensis TaxID=1176646 RepID=A0ABX6T0U4_9SPHN|nr:phytoene desaturase [Sphingomonas daechungensis]QNP43141.1 phytoene desaturase [Sphingomonas daechungensis]
MKRKAAVIGSGFGGLALAIRLQSAGIDTTVIEARDKPGGRAYHWEKDGHVFDAGPTVITDPACLRELWELTGADMARDVSLVPVSPFYRLSWPDGTIFDYVNDDERLFRQIEALEPADVEGYKRFLRYSEGVYVEGYEKLGAVPFLDFKSMLQAAPQLARYQAWRSVYSVVSRFVRNEKLRQALSFHSLLVGGNPMTTSAIYALIHKLERDGGVWFAEGGTNRLVAGMVTHLERIGGTVRLGDPVSGIWTEGDRATAVRTRSGWTGTFDAVASNADIVRTYEMLAHPSARRRSTSLKRKRFSPSLFVVHFSTTGSWEDVPHHSILFGPRYAALLKEIYRGSALPNDPSIYLHHPTATDASMAPEGRSTFYALAPVPHLGRTNFDWEKEGPAYAERLLEILEDRMLPGLRSRLGEVFHFGPADFEQELNSHLGSAFSLEPVLTQSAYFRVHNRDDVVRNLYFVGAGTHPGAGIPGVVGSAKATAGLMIEDLAA